MFLRRWAWPARLDTFPPFPRFLLSGTAGKARLLTLWVAIRHAREGIYACINSSTDSPLCTYLSPLAPLLYISEVHSARGMQPKYCPRPYIRFGILTFPLPSLIAYIEGEYRRCKMEIPITPHCPTSHELDAEEGHDMDPSAHAVQDLTLIFTLILNFILLLTLSGIKASKLLQGNDCGSCRVRRSVSWRVCASREKWYVQL
jgi:hypothetical protein